MKRIFLFVSPHLDDVVISCGDYIYSLVQNGIDVIVATVFTGGDSVNSPSMLARIIHKKTGLNLNALKIRRQEDRNAVQLLGADFIHFPLLECIYRSKQDGHPVYRKLHELFHVDLNTENETIEQVISSLSSGIEMGAYDRIYIPLAIGRHVDHCIVRHAIEQIIHSTNNIALDKLFYYKDLPYVSYNNDVNWREELTCGLEQISLYLPHHYLKIKIKAIEQYSSQFKLLWPSKYTMLKQMIQYSRKTNGPQIKPSCTSYSFEIYAAERRRLTMH